MGAVHCSHKWQRNAATVAGIGEIKILGGFQMPLVMRIKGRRSCPVAVCDFCGQEIEDAKDGNCQWKMGEEEAGQGATLYFTHKKCCRAFEATNEAPLWGAQMLDHFLVFLANNTNLDWKKAEKGARVIASIG
jgi:hypothetical protein